MKVNFDTILKNLKDEDIKDGEEKLTLKSAAINALMLPYQDELNLKGEEKLKRFTIAQKIQAGGEVELPVEEVAKVKELIGKLYNPLIVGRAWALLES